MIKHRKNTATADLLDALESGEEYSVTDIKYFFGIINPTATIAYLRNCGYPIYTNTRKSKDGNKIKLYKIGKPRRALIAAGYKLLGAVIYK